MKLTNGIAATIQHEGTEKKTTEGDVRTVLYAAFPVPMGQYPVEIEHTHDFEWLVTLSTGEWEMIEKLGYFEFGVELADRSDIKMIIKSAADVDTEDN